MAAPYRPRMPLEDSLPQLQREPIIVVNVLCILLLEVYVFLRSFKKRITEAQQRSIIAVATLVIPIGGALIARRFTTPLVDPRDNNEQPLKTAVPADAPPLPKEGPHSDE